nr:hypothetical protein [Campylobacter troglodytis]
MVSVDVGLVAKHLCFTLLSLLSLCEKGYLSEIARVYTLKHCSAKELLPIIKDFSELNECEIYSDSLKAYDGLVDFCFVLSCNFKEQSYGGKTL